MKISLFCLLIFLLGVPFAHAQSAPGDEQDAEASREKILKAADQLDMIESNSESTKVQVDAMKADLGKLQDANTALKQQLADMQAAFDKSETDRAKERQVLLDEVSKMVASGKSGASLAKKKAAPSPAEATTETAPADASPAPAESPAAPAPDATSEAVAAPTAPPPPPPKPQKGYYHFVESGETLTMIVAAYRQQGVHVTVSQVRKANDLTEKSVLNVGQKLFIPKPGT